MPEEKAFKLAIEHVNADTKNYPGIELRWVIRYADPDNDFDNIARGKDLLDPNCSLFLKGCSIVCGMALCWESCIFVNVTLVEPAFTSFGGKLHGQPFGLHLTLRFGKTSKNFEDNQKNKLSIFNVSHNKERSDRGKKKQATSKRCSK